MISLLALVVLFDGDLSRTSVSGGTFSVSGEWDLSRCGAITVELDEPEPPCEGWNFDILLDGEDGSYRIGAQVTEDKPPQSVFERPLPPFWPEFHEVMKRMPGSEDLPLGLYALAWPSVYWGGQGAGWGNRIHACNLDPRHVTKVSIVRGTYGKVPTPKTPPKVKRITAGGAPYAGPVPDFVRQAPDRFFPFMDRFGQVKARTWPGKVSSDRDFQRAIAAEDADLAAHPGPKDRDKWGGWTAGPRFEATGHFYVKKVDGKWWFVDPDGYLWWSHGPVRVSPSCGMTPIKGREHFFEFLPQEGDPFAAFYRTRDALLWPYYVKRGVTNTYDFTASNLYRKYGDDWFAKWADRAHRRLRSWGANTIANSSDLRLARMSRTPYCDRFELKSRPIKGTENLGAWWPFRDPFDPSFRANLREQLLAHKDELDDPWCFGFFIDNELRWGEEGELAKWVWDSPDDQPAKVEFRRRLVAKYGRVPEPIPHEDLKAFSEAVIRGYFSSVREEFKKVAPKKMYMGCRFSGAREFVARIAAEYADVMSFNYYRKDVSGFSALPADVDRPIIIGEFHFGALDRGPIRPGLIQYASQAERAAGYVRYLESALQDPRFVGAHWHQWCDDVSTGRFDGENFQIGWVDVCDNPYPETIAAVRDIGERMYMIRSGAGAAVAAVSAADARIVRAVRETPVQRIAADELAHHLELITGRKPEVASAPGTGLSFVFGKPADAPDAGPFESCYRIDGNTVWFWGGEGKGFPGVHQGSRFAVSSFLEKHFGVKWVAPGDKGIVFRRMKHLALPEKYDFSYKPPLAMEILRNSTVRYLTVPALPLGCFLKDDPVPEKLRLSDAEAAAATLAAADWKYRHLLFSPDMPLYGHAFTKWQPRFRETHPEYLALDEKGNRVQSPTYDAWIKLCISNEAVVDQIIADWQAAGCPHYINVCENDGAGFCRCENCLRLDADRPGEDFLATKTDRYLNFYNRVTKKAIAIRPDVQVCAYLYAFYRHPPRRERIEYPDNMVFGMVPSLADDIDAFFTSWQAVGLKQFFFRPNFHTSLGNLPRGVEKEIYDIFKKALSYGLIGVDFDAYLWRDVLAPESYVTARMIGHPDRSFDELMDELCSAYGEAKPAVSAYFARIRARQEDEKRGLNEKLKKANVLDDSLFVSAQMALHSEEALKEDLSVLENAAAPSEPEMAARLDDLVVRARHYVLCYRFLAAGSSKDDAALAARGRELLRYRLDHADQLKDMYENVMNTRSKGTEGHLWKRIPEVLRGFGGLTPREKPLGMYN